MQASHSMSFCTTCGNLLDLPTVHDVVACQLCGESVDCNVFENVQVVAHSRPGIFAPRKVADSAAADAETAQRGATIREKCPKCDATEMTFHTMQLRSADEGQTVFYSCRKCGYKYSINS